MNRTPADRSASEATTPPSKAPDRWRRLPDRGSLLVSTDLHGNGDDFRALTSIFDWLCEVSEAGAPAHWVLLGDTVHAPSDEARQQRPELYDFPDESFAIVDAILELDRLHPGQIHYVLGNHDYAHIGGPRTRKFHDDEAAHLEATLDEAQRQRLRQLFAPSLLAVVAPCGAFLTHGSPDAELRGLTDLDQLPLPPRAEDTHRRHLIDTFLTSYGQRGEVTARLLATLSRGADSPVTFVAHGHDRDEKGFYIEGDNQICPCLFGAPRHEKRYLLLDLAARYAGVHALRDGRELLRLHRPA